MGITQSLTTSSEKNNTSNICPIKLNPSASNGLYSKLLINGYIREIQYKLNRQIPIDIIAICCDFYSSKIILIYLNEGFRNEPFEICVTDFYERSRKYKSNICLINDGIQQNDIQPNIINNTSIFFAKNINLPTTMLTKLNANSRTQFDVIFRCGGKYKRSLTFNCNALIWKSNIRRHGNKNKKLDIYHYQLPAVDNTMQFSSVLYSDKYSSLYAVSGSNVSQLNISDNELKWEILTDPNEDNQNINTRSLIPKTCVLIEEEYTQQILIIDIGGRIQRIRIFDVTDHKWQSSTISKYLCPRSKYGALYVKTDKTVYIGGGHASDHVAPEVAACCVEYYDLNTTKWYSDIPKTLMKHDHYPILWKDGHLLYIASVKAIGIEWIDLRDNNRKWNMYRDSLNNYFDTEIQSYNAYRCRLLR